jgi:multidrug resistance efflux pump
LHQGQLLQRTQRRRLEELEAAFAQLRREIDITDAEMEKHRSNIASIEVILSQHP